MRLIDADELKRRILEERDKIPLTIVERYSFGVGTPNRHGQSMRGGIRKALRRMEETPTLEMKPLVYGQKVVINRPRSAAYLYIQEGSDGSLNVNWYGDGKRVLVHGAIENNPVEYCSVCGARLDEIYQNFCPNCGAEMTGE